MKKNDTASYIFAKLLVILVIDAVAVISALLFRALLSGFKIEGIGEAETENIKNIILSFISGTAFILYAFYTVYKMKLPIGKNPFVFAIKETIPYIIFLIPLAVATFTGSNSAYLSSPLGYIYAPHLAGRLLGLPIIANAAIYTAVYYFTNALAYILGIRKAVAEEPPEKKSYVSYDYEDMTESPTEKTGEEDKGE